MKSSVLLDTTSAATNLNSLWYDLGDGTNFTAAIAFTGVNVVGTLTLQGAAGTSDANTDASAIIGTISGSSQAVSSSTNVIYSVSGVGYRWVRVVWAYTSGTGNIKIVVDEKEPQRKL